MPGEPRRVQPSRINPRNWETPIEVSVRRLAPRLAVVTGKGRKPGRSTSAASGQGRRAGAAQPAQNLGTAPLDNTEEVHLGNVLETASGRWMASQVPVCVPEQVNRPTKVPPLATSSTI
jgi:hypothetical protein